MNYSTKTANQILLRDESRQLVLDEIWDNSECLWKEASLRTLLVCCFKYLACKISWLLLLLSNDVSSRDEEVDDDGDDMDDMIVPESAKRWYYIFTLFDTHLPPPLVIQQNNKPNTHGGKKASAFVSLRSFALNLYWEAHWNNSKTRTADNGGMWQENSVGWQYRKYGDV